MVDKNELLKEAYKRYPIGTKFRSILNDSGLIREVQPYNVMQHNAVEYAFKLGDHSECKAKEGMIWCSRGISTEGGGCSNPAIYCDGVWCPVIESNYNIY